MSYIDHSRSIDHPTYPSRREDQLFPRGGSTAPRLPLQLGQTARRPASGCSGCDPLKRSGPRSTFLIRFRDRGLRSGVAPVSSVFSTTPQIGVVCSTGRSNALRPRVATREPCGRAALGHRGLGDALVGGTAITIAESKPLTDSVILVSDGRIEKIGKRNRVHREQSLCIDGGTSLVTPTDQVFPANHHIIRIGHWWLQIGNF